MLVFREASPEGTVIHITQKENRYTLQMPILDQKDKQSDTRRNR